MFSLLVEKKEIHLCPLFLFSGDVLRWEQQIRLRHMLTRQYLCIDSRSEVSLIVDPSDPRTVFRLHSVLKVLIGAWECFYVSFQSIVARTMPILLQALPRVMVNIYDKHVTLTKSYIYMLNNHMLSRFRLFYFI